MKNALFLLGTRDDLDRLVELNSLGSDEGKVEARKELPRFIDGQTLLCARVNEQIVGLLYWKKSFMKNNQWYLTQITVDESWRRKGIGEALLKNFFDLAKKDGVQEIIADVKTSNQPSRSMIQKLGGEEIGSITFDKGDDLRLLYRIRL